jgi:hypothetical protein
MTREEVEKLPSWQKHPVKVRTRKGFVDADFLHICYPPDGPPRNAKVRIDGMDKYVPFERMELPA